MKNSVSRRLVFVATVVLATTAVSAAAMTGVFDPAGTEPQEPTTAFTGSMSATPETGPTTDPSSLTGAGETSVADPSSQAMALTLVPSEPAAESESRNDVSVSGAVEEPVAEPAPQPAPEPEQPPAPEQSAPALTGSTDPLPPGEPPFAQAPLAEEVPPAAPEAESEPALTWVGNGDGTYTITWTGLTPQYSLYVDGALQATTDQDSYLFTPPFPGQYALSVIDSAAVTVTGDLVATGVRAEGNNARGQLDISGWRDIVDVAAGQYHTVGLTASGSVVATGSNDHGQCDTAAWTGVSDVEAGWNHTLGRLADGTVVAVGRNDYGQRDVGGWAGITKLAAGSQFTVGLKSDGTVVAAGRNQYGQCNVSGWTDVVDIACGSVHTIGLKSDGTMLYAGPSAATAGMYNLGQGAVSGWSGILPGGIGAGQAHSLALSGDSVRGCGWNADGQLTGVSGWGPLVAIDGGLGNTVGLKSDGTVVVAGRWWNDVTSEFAPFAGAAGWTGIDQVSSQGDFIVGLVR